jgi:hypothetical protein
MISAILERKVWTETDVRPLFPNTYIVLSGHPGSGKSVGVGLAREMLAGLGGAGGIHLGPDNPTEASFMDALYASAKPSINGSGGILHSCMTVLCREFGVLIPKYSESFMATLGDLWDNPPMFTAPRRQSKSVAIECPTLNLLAAATPAALGDMPEKAWKEGFASRVIFIYGASAKEYRNVFVKPRLADLSRLKKTLDEWFHEIHGAFEWSDAAADAHLKWLNGENLAPVPTYGRLEHYLSRRNEHAMKLMMISSVSAGNGLVIELSDFERGRQWLLDAEQTMPDVFRAMSQKSDMQIMQDAHHFVYARYSRVGLKDRKPVAETLVARFFENKTTSERITGLIETMVRTGRLKRTQFGGYVPGELDISQSIE